MLHYYNGTIFNTPAKALVNTINTTGAMGSGIALEFSLRYPEMFDDYIEKCKNDQISIGKIDYFIATDKTIINFPTKQYFKYPSRLEWIEAGLKDFVLTYKEHNITSVAFPKLGTLNGKLDWRIVKNLMEKYLSNIDADVYICLDENNIAEGKEKEMLNLFNNCNIDELVSELNLNAKQKEYLSNNRPFNRFWQIGKDKPIKGLAYKKIFQYFYDYTPPEFPMPEQITLFDL